MIGKLLGAIIGIGISLVSVPIAIILTILLVPFWSWFEAESGFESLGHSGPAEWCYFIIYILVVLAGIWLWFLQRKNT